MLARYTMYRGKRPAADPLPEGLRQDTRKHTRHPLRPAARLVQDYLANPNPEAWSRFKREYLADLKSRFVRQRASFDELARVASTKDVFLGCSCPTRQNPDVTHCHTFLALHFMKDRYPELTVQFPHA